MVNAVGTQTLMEYLAAVLGRGETMHTCCVDRDGSGRIVMSVTPYGGGGEQLEFVVQGNALYPVSALPGDQLAEPPPAQPDVMGLILEELRIHTNLWVPILAKSYPPKGDLL